VLLSSSVSLHVSSKASQDLANAAARRHERIFLITSDSEFFEDLNYEELARRYPDEARRAKVVPPNDPNLTNSLACNNTFPRAPAT
jgi:hypothetical protein